MLRASYVVPLTLMLLLFAPAAAHAQTPENWFEPARETVVDVTVGGHDAPPVFTGMARLTFPPNAHIIGGTIAGARLFLIESGSFEIEADDPVTIYLSVGPSTKLQADDQITLHFDQEHMHLFDGATEQALPPA